MSALLINVAEQCRYCGKQRQPHDMMSLPLSNVRVCLQCFDRTQRAYQFFGGHEAPPNCQECGVSFLDLSELSASGDTDVSLRFIDGIVQVLCSTCSRAFELGSKNRYKGTKYGYELFKE